MSLSGVRLQTALAADIFTQLQTIFPINASLKTAEKAYLQSAQQNLATAIANATGPDVVTEITGNAAVTPNTLAITPASVIAPSGGGACSGVGTVTTGTGKVT